MRPAKTPVNPWLRPLMPLWKLWVAIGHVLGWVNSRILLTVVFFGLIFPLGAIRRLAGAKTLPKGPDASLPTYRIESRREPVDFEKPY